jgi:hypothetical protein
MVNDKEVEPLSGIVGAPNAFVKVGALMTFKVAVAVLPVPPLVETTAFVALVFAPSELPLTSTLTAQDAF